MKNIMKDILFGFLIIVVTLIFEYIVTIPFDNEVANEVDRAYWAFIWNRELLLTALPAALTTFAFSWLLKTKTKADALRRAIIWASILALFYFFIGINNGCFDVMFGGIGVYAVIVLAFVGPLIYSSIKRLK
jgi:hypothetical protein